MKCEPSAALAKPREPARSYRARLHRFLSDYVLAEIRELPEKIKPSRGVTAERVELLIQDVCTVAELWKDVPDVFTHPIDPDDSHYVNLAQASQSTRILTNDNHLLNLPSRIGGVAFVQQFAGLTI